MAALDLKPQIEANMITSKCCPRIKTIFTNDLLQFLPTNFGIKAALISSSHRNARNIKKKSCRLALDCLQSAFSLKIRIVLMSSSAIANHDFITTIRD